MPTTSARTAAYLAAASLFFFATSGRAWAQAREQTLYVSVIDGKGAPVIDLEARDYVVREDGVPREVLRVSRATEPIDIALLVDDSTAASGQIVQLREALSRFVDLMHRDNNIAVVGLAPRPTILTDYTRNVGQLKAGIGRVFPVGDTGMTLLDALVEMSRGLERRDAPRAALIAVLTDGPELGNYDDQTVLKALKKAGAAFHAVSVGTFTATTPEPYRYRLLLLTEGTRATGGRHDNLLVATGLPQAMEKLARELSSQQKVVYGRPESLIPPGSIEVRVARPGLTARGTPARRAGGRP